MDSSSDGSFAWTDASDDTTDIERSKTKMNTSQLGEESDSGKTYKKKLQKELFLDKNDSNNDVESHNRRKRTLSPQHSDTEHSESPRKKRIKLEPESDVDTKKVKKRHKHSDTNSQDVSHEPYNESYLDLQVKNEQSFAVPSTVKIKRSKNKNMSSLSDASFNNGDMADSHQSPTSFEPKDKGYSNVQIQFEDDSTQIEEDNKCDIFEAKKKKKKTKRKRDDSESKSSTKDSSNIDSFCAQETAAEEHDQSELQGDSPDDTINTSSKLNHVQKGSKSRTKKETKHGEKVQNGNIFPKENIDDGSQTSSSRDSVKCKSILSERITFEDEEDSDVQTTITKPSYNKKNNKKSKLKSFVDSSISLRPFCKKVPSALILTDDDDVWVIRCPKDVKVEAFQDKKWTLDSKCKIKLEGQTYEGEVDDKQINMAILSSANDRAVIKNLTINGCVRLHRRIPKVHMQEDNIMVDNQSTFIPLPDTKCRHPLFGFNYKKAIKLPSAVAQRLTEACSETIISTEKRKKRKDKRKSEAMEPVSSTTAKVDLHSETSPAPEAQPIAKKKKKRKHSETAEEFSAPRKKRIKHDPESAAAWESEKAIEENLFNF